MAVKKSVRLTDDTCELLHKLTLTGDTNWSGSINAMAEQYALLIADNTPPLEEWQWLCFYCGFNGYMPHPDIKSELSRMDWLISESYQYDEQVREIIDENGDVSEFVAQVKGWTTSQKLAVMFKARAYWRQGPVVEAEDE